LILLSFSLKGTKTERLLLLFAMLMRKDK